MRYIALATDYDGTLAHHGSVSPAALAALRRFGSAGRKLILVTGRELDDLLGVFPQIEVFDRVVAENGGLLYCPATQAHKVLGVPPPPEFARELRRRGVRPLSMGRCIVATLEPNEGAVLATIRDLGLELQVIFNKGAVMVLPAGVNKATGLTAALDDLQLSARNVVAIGDAENDHALLHAAEFGVAVGNALPMLKREADRASERPHGEAVVETLEAILADDLRSLSPALSARRALSLGFRPGEDGDALTVPVADHDILVTGASGSGKSVFVRTLLERLGAAGYQYCVIDPEGDYDETPHAVMLGTTQRAPSAEELVKVLADNPGTSAIVNLAAVRPRSRRSLCKEMTGRLREMRGRIGRPHWWVLAEAHQLCGKDSEPLFQREAGGSSVIYVSPHPTGIAPSVLDTIHLGVVIGIPSQAALAELGRAFGADLVLPHAARPAATHALAWFTGRDDPPLVFEPSLGEDKPREGGGTRVGRESDLPPERSFYFRGPQGKVNLRAQNVTLFLQIASGVDDETFDHHLRAGDYSHWLRTAFGNAALASEVHAIETACGTVAESRELISKAIGSYFAI